MQPAILENETLRLTFDRTTGALIGLTAVQTGWEILNRPRLGLSFRLLVPLASDDPLDVAFAERMGRGRGERRNNPVYGEKQKLAKLELAPDVWAAPGKAATFTWENVMSEVGGLPPTMSAAMESASGGRPAERVLASGKQPAGLLPITVTLAVTLTDRQAIFAMTVENRSRHVVENVYCPYLGDVQHPAGEEWFKTFSYVYATAQEWPLWPTYDGRPPASPLRGLREPEDRPDRCGRRELRRGAGRDSDRQRPDRFRKPVRSVLSLGGRSYLAARSCGRRPATDVCCGRDNGVSRRTAMAMTEPA